MLRLSHIATAKKYAKTYRLGLLQAHAYRILKQRTTSVLEQYNLSTLDWALLGALHDDGEMTYKHAAHLLAVTSPVVTSLCERLLEKKLITIRKDESDARIKHISLTSHGSTFVSTKEADIRTAMKDVVAKASTRDLLGYVAVLQAIIDSEKGENVKPHTWF